MMRLLKREVFLRSNSLKRRYDVVIIGGGGHGLATAYYLAKNHGVRDVAVLERSYIGSGGTGRNTTIVRANYKTPETIAFYKRSYEMFRQLSLELDYNLLLTKRGLFWMAHSENQLRLQRERAYLNQAFGVNTVFLTPPEIQKALSPARHDWWREIPNFGCGLSSWRLYHPSRRRCLGICGSRTRTRCSHTSGCRSYWGFCSR